MDDLAKRITEIEACDRDQCLAAWTKLAEAPPGLRLSLSFLRKALIFGRCRVNVTMPLPFFKAH